MDQDLTPTQRNAKVFTELSELNHFEIFAGNDEDGGVIRSIPSLLYVSHEKWAKKQAIEFKCLHYYKCRGLSLEDLEFSSKIGLLKSANRYNGRTKFTRFSEIYVKSELLRALTTHLSITACVSPKKRMRSNVATNDIPHNKYPIIIRHDKNTISTIFQPQVEIQNKEFYQSVWDFVETFNEFTKHVIRTKYDYEFKVRKTNAEIARMIDCSEETVRKSVNQFSRAYLEEMNKPL
jgi:RNA polymerase sigma factor (sigma-70 family)